MRVKSYGNRFKQFNNRAKYFRYEACKAVILAIQGDVPLSNNDRLYVDYIIGLNINEGLWGAYRALYGMLGGTSASHKWNWKDPRNLDAAFRLTFSGTATHSSLGYVLDGTSHADTNFVPSTGLTDTSKITIGFYSQTQNITGIQVDFGAAVNGIIMPTTGVTGLVVSYLGNAYFETNSDSGSTGNAIASNSNTKGLFVGARNINSITLHRNAALLATNTSASQTITSSSLYLGARHYQSASTNPNFFSLKTISLAFIIDDGLQSADVIRISNIMMAGQGIINRK